MLILVFDAHYNKFWWILWEEISQNLNDSAQIQILKGYPMIHQQSVMFKFDTQVKETYAHVKLFL